MDILEYLKQQQQAAMRDYSGLLQSYPNAVRFGNGLLTSIDSHVPIASDYDIKNHPEHMKEWSMSVFENGPGAISKNFLPRAYDHMVGPVK
jgi:hypothetical protein